LRGKSAHTWCAASSGGLTLNITPFTTKTPQILINGTARRFRGKSLLAFNAILPIGIGPDRAGIDRKTFSDNQVADGCSGARWSQTVVAADRSPGNDHGGSSRRSSGRRHRHQAGAAKPAIRQVQVDFFAQPPLGSDPEAVSDQQHSDINSGVIEGRPIVLQNADSSTVSVRSALRTDRSTAKDD
jgi:hypothetical protein